MSILRTPAELAAALRQVADDLEALPDATRKRDHIMVTLSIQPDGPADVDRFSVALYGKPGHPQEMSGGSWHHTSHAREHRSGISVPVFCATGNPEVAALKAEIEALRAGRASVKPPAEAGDGDGS